jgi:predicted metal-binding membrane protein
VTAVPVAGRLTWVRWHHPEWTVALVALAAWVVLAELHRRGWGPFGSHPAAKATVPAGHEAMHHAGHQAAAAAGVAPAGTAVTGWLAAQGGWLLMATAMMLPSALPSVRRVAMNSKWRRRQRAGAAFVAAYLAVWGLFGLLAVSVARWAGVPAGVGWPLVAALVVAAAWELTPSKRRWLRACHRSLALPPDGWKADLGCVAAGFRYGWACVRACWALMLPMAVAGHAGLALMAVLTVVAAAEEVLVKGTQMTRAAALVLLAAAALAAIG